MSEIAKSETPLGELVTQMRRDGMVLRELRVAVADIVYLKDVLEAYPGIASIHAEPAEKGRAPRATADLLVAATPAFEAELDAVLEELAEEIPGLCWNSAARVAVVDGGDCTVAR